MTSILGIRTNTGEEGIIIAADTQLNVYDQDGKSMIAKRPMYKIWFGKYWALALSGGVERDLHHLHSLLSGHRRYDSSDEKVENLIEKAIKEKYLEEVNKLNREQRRRGIPLDDLNAFIFAATKPELSLWYINEFGTLLDYQQVAKIEEEEPEFEYLVLGSGEKKIRSYIEDKLDDEKSPLDPNTITISTAVTLAFDALRKAESDAHTGGPIDVVVLTKKGVDAYGKRIRDAVRDAERKIVDSITQIYAPPEERE